MAADEGGAKVPLLNFWPLSNDKHFSHWLAKA